MKRTISQHLLVAVLGAIFLLTPALGLTQIPVPRVRSNGSDGPLTVGPTDPVTITISLEPNGLNTEADWFFAVDTPFGLVYHTPQGWSASPAPYTQGALYSLSTTDLWQGTLSGLPSGLYTVYFGVDTRRDGAVTWDQLHYDSVEVNLNGPPSASAYFAADKGGTLAVTNTQGDQIELEIPPGALPISGKIAILAHNSPPASPIAQTTFPGVTLFPRGLVLQEPARLRITPAVSARVEPMIFGLWAPDFAVPAADATAYSVLSAQAKEKDTQEQAGKPRSNGKKTYQCEVFKGRTYIGGVPSASEAKTQSDKLVEIPPLSYPDWQTAKEKIRGLLVWIEYFWLLGDTTQADVVLNRVRDIAGEVIEEFLEVPAPANPCDKAYTKLLFELGELGMVGLTHDMPEASREFQKRFEIVVDFCSNRYELEVDHKLTTLDREGSYELLVEAQIKGRIPISLVVGENSAAQGYGALTITGQGHSGDCTIAVTASGDLAIAGRLNFGKYIDLELHLEHNFNETWTMSCPNGTGEPGYSNWCESAIVDQTLHIAPFNGSRIEQTEVNGPFTHELSWTLHVINQQ